MFLHCKLSKLVMYIKPICITISIETTNNEGQHSTRWHGKTYYFQNIPNWGDFCTKWFLNCLPSQKINYLHLSRFHVNYKLRNLDLWPHASDRNNKLKWLFDTVTGSLIFQDLFKTWQSFCTVKTKFNLTIFNYVKKTKWSFPPNTHWKKWWYLFWGHDLNIF